MSHNSPKEDYYGAIAVTKGFDPTKDNKTAEKISEMAEKLAKQENILPISKGQLAKDKTFDSPHQVDPGILENLQVVGEMPNAVKPDNGGLRFNEGKPRFDLIPPEALFALAEHFRKGAEKYDENNWLRGMDWNKCFASLQRHAWAWEQGEEFDEETGSHHMIAIAWNAFAIFTYYTRNIGVDNRLLKNEKA